MKRKLKRCGNCGHGCGIVIVSDKTLHCEDWKSRKTKRTASKLTDKSEKEAK